MVENVTMQLIVKVLGVKDRVLKKKNTQHPTEPNNNNKNMF